MHWSPQAINPTPDESAALIGLFYACVLRPYSVNCDSWLACDGINWVPDTPRCMHRRQASSHRKACLPDLKSSTKKPGSMIRVDSYVALLTPWRPPGC